ncbi:GIY-YIG nuclease family protein [Micromonospora parva]|uniref:GIY-YIG nuclease family protein n=1 Tax=Micromonospora parva TaxID=1464048 RepID=UPI0033C2DC78
MSDTSSDDPLSGFSPARPYTRDTAGDAPQTPGVHVVVENGEVVYVGSTGDLRRRLRQHLTGNRGSSVLHDQVGRLLDQHGAPAAAADIANWLAHCDLRWPRTDDARGVKEALVATLGPRFNRHVPKEARLPEVSAQVLNVDDLLDRGLIWIDESYVLHVVGGTEHYSGYHGQRIRLPRRIEDLPDPEALLRHRRDVACIP